MTPLARAALAFVLSLTLPSLVLVRKGGAWRAKALVEGGWGDTPMPGAEKASGAPGAP